MIRSHLYKNMEVTEIKNKKDSESLVLFIDDMFDKWLDKSSFAKENSCCPGRTYDQIKKKIDQMDNCKYEFIICTNAKKVVGMTYISFFDDESLYLGLINVHPEYREKGIFKKILDKAEEICQVKKMKSMRLCTWHKNEKAIHTFLKYGFEVYKQDDKSIELRKNVY